MGHPPIEVHVKLFGLLRPHHPGPNRSLALPVMVPAGTSARGVAEALALPPALTRMVFINEQQATLDDPLLAGDQLKFFTSVVGG